MSNPAIIDRDSIKAALVKAIAVHYDMPEQFVHVPLAETQTDAVLALLEASSEAQPFAELVVTDTSMSDKELRASAYALATDIGVADGMNSDDIIALGDKLANRIMFSGPKPDREDTVRLTFKIGTAGLENFIRSADEIKRVVSQAATRPFRPFDPPYMAQQAKPDANGFWNAPPRRTETVSKGMRTAIRHEAWEDCKKVMVNCIDAQIKGDGDDGFTLRGFHTSALGRVKDFINSFFFDPEKP